MSGQRPRMLYMGKPIQGILSMAGFAEKQLLHENAVVKIADDIPLDRAALVGCGVTTGVGAALNTAKVAPGDNKALATARELLSIGSASFGGAFWPQYAWWAASQGLAAGGNAGEAREAAAQARRELHAFAERIADERARTAFLQLPLNTRIAAAAS